MRGKVSDGEIAKGKVRITPAYAGKRPAASAPVSGQRDYPRVCGEKPARSRARRRNWGSPPRMRGKVQVVCRCCLSCGITPAYAGKSEDEKPEVRCNWDHPRVCGEKCASDLIGYLLHGITPAYAGKRLKRSRSTVPPVAIVPLFPSVCNKTVVSDGSPAGRDAPLFLPAENAVPASPAYNLRSL